MNTIDFQICLVILYLTDNQLQIVVLLTHAFPVIVDGK